MTAAALGLRAYFVVRLLSKIADPTACLQRKFIQIRHNIYIPLPHITAAVQVCHVFLGGTVVHYRLIACRRGMLMMDRGSYEVINTLCRMMSD